MKISRLFDTFKRPAPAAGEGAPLPKARKAGTSTELRELRGRVRALKRSQQRLKGRVLLAAVVEQTLELRFQALGRGSPRSDALARDADFRSRSASYLSVAASEERVAGCVGPVLTGSLQWWIPPPKGELHRNIASRMVSSQWLPFEDIVQTRELAIGTIMLDVGANIGTTSIPRVILGDFQYVYAAEPDARNYACLVQNVLANGLQGLVLPDQVAIAAHDGEASLLISPQIGEHRLLNAAAPASFEPATMTVVRCLTLDRWVESLGIDADRVTFIKCDTQGWEPHVLVGASDVLKCRHIAWQIEVTPKLMLAAGWRLPDFVDLVRTHFTHFIDLRGADPRRSRPTADLASALARLRSEDSFYTDLLVYNSSTVPRGVDCPARLRP